MKYCQGGVGKGIVPLLRMPADVFSKAQALVGQHADTGFAYQDTRSPCMVPPSSIDLPL